MDTQPAFGFKELLTCVITDMAKAISERNGETMQQQFTRSQAAVAMILGLRPRDVIEAILAGHCVMFHAVITDSVRETLRGELDTLRRGTRSNLVAMNKSFTGNLALLERYQMRPSEGSRDAPEIRPADAAANIATPSQAPGPDAATQLPQPANAATVSHAATSTGSRAAAQVAVATPTITVSTQAAASVSTATPVPVVAVEAPAAIADWSALPEPAAPGFATAQTLTPQSRSVPPRIAPARPDPVATGGPSVRTLAAFHANPEAEAALEAGDPARFARAMGIEPSQEFLAAAAEPGSPFDRHAAGPWLVDPAFGGGKG